MNNKRILFAGAGGQGIVSLGKIVASSALDDVPHITYFPAYGAEVRGGTANCQLVFSDKEIATPVSEEFDYMLLLNQASLDKFIKKATSDAKIVVDTTMCINIPDDPRIHKINATKLAAQLKNPRGANLIMLGALVQLDTKTFNIDSILKAIKDKFADKKDFVVEGNIACFKKGLVQK
jgi:2-oxoglutarate ferredoxin oxidoreductase subunit gamma